ncbi:MAG: inositol monophosphatase [Deltaproteobacteria bacterium]|nr:inositol monophosphatase [Deltaproteobacteria bacterium]
MNEQELEQALAGALEAARLGSDRVMAGWDHSFEFHKKGVVDLVTRFDRESERAIVGFLAERFPDDGVVAEEGGPTKRTGTRVWYVDPLDGTTNFVHGLPLFGVSVGLVLDDVPQVGVVQVPALGWTFAARRGGGATWNGRPMRASAVDEMDSALSVTGFPYSRRSQADRLGRFVSHFLTRAQGLRRLGAAALDLCFVARGWIDVYWESELKPWDLAAGIVICEEAGGAVTDWKGGPASSALFSGQVAASNGRLHEDLLGVLAEMTVGESLPGGGASTAPGDG